MEITMNENTLFPFFVSYAPRLVPRPILTVTWLGLEDKTIFQIKYQCVFLSLFLSIFRAELTELTKTTKGKRMNFCAKNTFVFQVQPRSHEYGCWN